jgi:hypothetical protein
MDDASVVNDASGVDDASVRHLSSTLVKGYEDIDLGDLSDMELSQPQRQPEVESQAWPHAVETLIGPIEMDEPTFQIYTQFTTYQGQWLSRIDKMYKLSALFKSEALPV